ncbi:hypothetical protein FJU08_01840 [Martelella alba]|uniref:Uncharacterized protein n=1 Tax=Martelella alba TaxID=2590451 RepID=A0A506UJ24_9HYPH|nr:hypothetical protein [Martelella alba]TPW33325.1 hypothetical protein FJU08_01840 [Martelella alba]
MSGDANETHHHIHLPSKARLASILAVAVYPLITLLLYGMSMVTAGWTIWQRTLVVTPVMVLLMVYVIIPGVHRLFSRFILRPVRVPVE